MNFIASFYSYSVTSSIYDIFHTPLNNFLSDGVRYEVNLALDKDV